MPPQSAPWPRVLALIYDRFLYLGEVAGMRAARRALLQRATGRVVEVGAGTGLNISQYPPEAEELILAEPEPAMRCRLERRLRRVEQPDRALAEIARVLRPGGQLLFIEHVRAESPALAWWQDRLLGPWRRFACGCRCNRATVELMRARGFEVTASKGIWRAMPPIVRPLVIGRAQLSGVCDA